MPSVRPIQRELHEVVPPPDAPPPPATLGEALGQAKGCRRCDLWRHATQTVFGEGPQDAPVMFVGEQPGDKEDIAGRPFIGPAGQLFRRLLGEARIDPAKCYVTNAVKHFKFEPRGKFRLHKKPDAAEIRICRWWLDLERAFVRPKLIVALGATGAQGLLGRAVTISKVRGSLMPLEEGAQLMVTVHPSYLLRIEDAGAKAHETERFIEDMRQVGRHVPEVRLA